MTKVANPSYRKRIERLKDGKVCMDCVTEGKDGIWPHECLDFDHRDPNLKLGSVRKFLYHPELLSEELEKCDVVCANHHRIRTRQRGVSQRTKDNIRVAKSTPESREQTRLSALGMWADPVRSKCHSDAVVAAQRTPEARDNNRRAQTKAWKDPEIRASRVLGMNTAAKDPEIAARRAESMRLAWADPVKRENWLRSRRGKTT